MEGLPPPNPNAPLRGSASVVSPQGLTAIIWTAFGVSTLLVTVRMAVRARQHGKLLVDDYWILLAWVCQLTMAILQTEQFDALWYATALVAGRFYPGAEAADKLYQLVRWQFPVIKLFWSVLWSIKASFLALFFGLVKQNTVLKRCWYGIVVFTSLGYIGCWLASALTCSPPSDYFVPGACESDEEKWRSRFNVLFSTCVDVASDLMIMSLPLALLPKLQLDIRSKIGLGFAFCLGWLIIGVAFVRMSQVIVNDTVDLVGLAIWGAIETTTAIVVGCLPAMKALLVKGIRSLSTHKRSNQSYGQYGPNSRRHDEFATNGTTRTVVVDGAIPLDEMGSKHNHANGHIYVQKTYNTYHETRPVSEFDSSSREEDEVKMVRGTRSPRF